MYPTVSDVLALPVIRQGQPKLVAGANGVDRTVRWVHIAEIADIAHLLRGGELVLTTGIALPDDPVALGHYVDELAGVGAAGLVVELVRRWSERVPVALRSAADRHSLPLVTLSAETRFVSVTEAVAALIQDAQLAELRAAEQVHETFTTLTVAGAEPGEVLREVARTARLPVVLETLSHDVLAYDAAGTDPGELLADWRARSRAVAPAERTGYDPASGWLVTVVGARGDDWGRLVLLCPGPPPHPQVVVVERAASALAVHRLVARDRDTLERQTHRSLLTDLLTPGALPADLSARAAALGIPLDGRKLVGLAVRPRVTQPHPAPALATQELLRDLAETTALAARRTGITALVATADDQGVQALVALDRRERSDTALRRLARGIHQGAAGHPRALPAVIAVGTTVSAVSDARRTLGEATHVAQAALRAEGAEPARGFHRLDDVRLRGLLHLLREDERVTAFIERELGALLAKDGGGGRLIDALRHYCEAGGNKSAAASAAHLSRTAYYQQLARTEQVLGISLADPESMLSLYVALLAWETTQT